MRADIVIRGGTLVDGTGSAGRRADVAVTGGRITGIGDGLEGERVLDADGQVVSPGFIDIHTHYDAQVFWDPDLTPSSFHGVTTVVAGNCGFSIAPIRPDGVELLAHTLQHVEDMSFDTLAAGVPWGDFETFPQYLDAVAARGTALNYACYVGHTAVRLYVMGEDAYERAATPEEIGLMQAVVADAMAGGAAGFASSASPTHNGDSGRPVPSRVADLAELRALLEPVKQSGRGVVALLPGGIFPNQEVFRLQREVGRPFTWTALLTVKGYPYHEKVIAEHDAAWAEGVEVWPQVSCRPLVFQMNLSEPFTLNMRPTFAALMGKTKAERVAAYRDPAWRASAWDDVSGKAGGFPLNWASISVAESRSHPDLADHPVARLAEERGCTPLDVMLDVSLDDDLESRFWSVLANDDPEGIALAPAARQRAPRTGGLGRARLAALRRLLLDGPAGQLGARARCHAPGAGHPQADGRAGGRLRPGRPGDDRGGQGRRPVRVRPRDRGPWSAPARARLPGRRRTPDRGRAGRHDPHLGERRADPHRRRAGSGGIGVPPRGRAALLNGPRAPSPR